MNAFTRTAEQVDMPDIVSFTAAVLAGGKSTRMGTDKAFLPIGDELLLERQLRCLRDTGAAELLISGRAGTDYSRFGIRVVCDEQPDCGPLAGIAALLRAASCSIVLVLAVDMPAMTSSMLAKIVSAAGESFGCVPVDDYGMQPLAAVYPKAALDLAQKHLASGRYSMKAFVTASVDAAIMRLLPMEAAETSCFTNWNRIDDWVLPEK